MRSRVFYTYILSSKRNGTLYVGITNNIERRVWEHKNKINPNSFTARYGVDKLMYYEEFDSPMEAIRREKRLKKYRRKEKLALIESVNPNWLDLARDWY